MKWGLNREERHHEGCGRRKRIWTLTELREMFREGELADTSWSPGRKECPSLSGDCSGLQLNQSPESFQLCGLEP